LRNNDGADGDASDQIPIRPNPVVPADPVDEGEEMQEVVSHSVERGRVLPDPFPGCGFGFQIGVGGLVEGVHRLAAGDLRVVGRVVLQFNMEDLCQTVADSRREFLGAGRGRLRRRGHWLAGQSRRRNYLRAGVGGAGCGCRFLFRFTDARRRWRG
jgi:hypothetical protein